MKQFSYDDTNIKSILAYAQGLVGKKISDILEEGNQVLDIKNKGIIGNIIEESYFGIKQNSSPLPDFSKVGIELKIIPLTQQIRKIAVKERTKICSINYQKLIDEEWESSHAKTKLNKILFIYYLYDKQNIKNSLVKKVNLWELSKDKSEIIIKDDWVKTKQKVMDGYAHELSEKNFKVLSPARSGSGGIDRNGEKKDLVPQPNVKLKDKALKRAFTLKQSFTNQMWNELNLVKYESILEILNINSMKDFERKILSALNLYEGKSIVEFSRIFDIIIPQGKNQIATIIKKAIGFKNVNSKIKEFEQLGILIKTIKVRKKDNMPLEDVSFSTMKLKEFENEAFETSTFKEYLQRLLFIPVYHENDSLDEKYLGHSFFWSPSEGEESTIKQEWSNYKKEVLSGACKVKKIIIKSKRGYKEVSMLSKASQTSIIHMRPKGKNSDDKDIDSLGNSIVKQCFWLNKKFLQKLITDSRN